MKKGIFFALLTAVVSGLAIFFNSFAVKNFTDPYFFTTAKNLLVTVIFCSIILGAFKWLDLRKLTTKQWGQLVLIGLVGGSLPFLLFFKGLALSTAAGGALIHKTLFIWVAILAVAFLKERLGWWQVFGLAILMTGTYFLGGPNNWHWGQGELLCFGATLLWAVESIIAKISLQKIPSLTAAWGRMFFGSIVLLGYIIIGGKIGEFSGLNLTQWAWLGVSVGFLFLYVSFWYTGLKYAPASVVASVLVLGLPITTVLSATFIKHSINLDQLIGVILIAGGLLSYVFLLPSLKKVLSRSKIKALKVHN